MVRREKSRVGRREEGGEEGEGWGRGGGGGRRMGEGCGKRAWSTIGYNCAWGVVYEKCQSEGGRVKVGG